MSRRRAHRSASGAHAIGWLIPAAAILAGFLGVRISIGEATAPSAGSGNVAVATFAGGCFWCMEPPFDKVDGVVRTTSGYTGGKTKNPSYEDVSAGGTGHAEAIEVVFDPAKVSYAELLDVFWKNIDPLAVGRQFCDVGTQYRSSIFYHDDTQRAAAEASKKKLEAAGVLKGGAIATEIVAATAFYPAEEYHQDYYVKNPLRYKYYRWGCGRDQRLEEIWGPAAEPH